MKIQINGHLVAARIADRYLFQTMVRRVWLFGSATKGGHNPWNDIDLVLEVDKLTFARFLDAYQPLLDEATKPSYYPEQEAAALINHRNTIIRQLIGNVPIFPLELSADIVIYDGIKVDTIILPKDWCLRPQDFDELIPAPDHGFVRRVAEQALLYIPSTSEWFRVT